MPPHANLSLSIGTGSGAGRVAAELLKILYDQGEALALAGRAAMAEAFVIALVQAIGETSDAHMPATRKSRRVNEILRVIEIHAPNPALSVGDVAMKCGISRRHLSDLLRREGLAFSRYLQDRRLKIAEDMLLSPAMRDQSIGEIAQMAGFASAQYFCRIFKASKGQTPGAFRQSESGLSAVSA
jgi:AraC-like DNA-binding protein